MPYSRETEQFISCLEMFVRVPRSTVIAAINEIVSSEIEEEVQPSVNLFPVKSSVIEEVGYDYEDGTLFIKMHKNDRIYKYPKVPWQTFMQFIHAESLGHFYTENIKGQY